MNDVKSSHLQLVNTVDEAISTLSELGDTAIPVAGATWIMRGPIRREKLDKVFVSLMRIKELHEITFCKDEVSIGSLVTHDQLAKALCEQQDLQGLMQASGNSANPAIRRTATIGGNICTKDFAAADLIPSLISLNASVEVRDKMESNLVSIEDFLGSRFEKKMPYLITRIIVPRSKGYSAHARITMRKAGEYAIGNVSVAITLDSHGNIEHARVSVGSVENVAKRWKGFEAILVGKVPNSVDMKVLAQECLHEFSGREGTDAPGWYRVRVLPSLVQQTFENLSEQFRGMK